MTEQKPTPPILTVSILPYNEDEFVEYVRKQAEGRYAVVVGVDSNERARRIARKLSSLYTSVATYDPSKHLEFVLHTSPWNDICHAHEGIKATINTRTRAEGEIHRARIHMEEHPDPTCLYFQQNENMKLLFNNHYFHILVTSIPRLA